MDDRSEDEQIKGKADTEREDSDVLETTEDEAVATSEKSDQGGNASARMSENTVRSFSTNMNIARLLSIVMLILGIIAVGVLFYRVMAGFFVPLFLAVLLVVLFRPLHEWILRRSNGRSRLACTATTGLILGVVLLPIIIVISIAAGQFTSMVSHVNFEDLTAAFQRARQQFGVSLSHPEQFRRLDQLADNVGELDDRVLRSDNLAAQQQVREALLLIEYLQAEEQGSGDAEPAAESAKSNLQELLVAIENHGPSVTTENSKETAAALNSPPNLNQNATQSTTVGEGGMERQTAPDVVKSTPQGEGQTTLVDRIRGEEAFHRKSVIASAAIRTWMREFLGGTFLSQAKLFANPSAEDFKSLLSRARQSLQPRFVTFTSVTGSFLVESLLSLVVLVIAVYFFLHDGAAMIKTLMRLSPLDDRYEERLLLEFERTSRAVVLATVASAIGQGVLASIAFYFLGFESVIFLLLITSMMSLIPFLGAAAVWVPCAIYLATVDQRWGAAIFLAIYGATVVSSIDNFIKMYVLHGRSTLHPLFALLSVLGGVNVFGPIGILVGPMVVVFLQTLLEILSHELAERKENPAANSAEN
ncbi:MAG: AI-2E family transporter [Planctomycetota bacterium]|nr:AI-2E family transporter [Planctomycetota bacterium]